MSSFTQPRVCSTFALQICAKKLDNMVSWWKFRLRNRPHEAKQNWIRRFDTEHFFSWTTFVQKINSVFFSLGLGSSSVSSKALDFKSCINTDGLAREREKRYNNFFFLLSSFLFLSFLVSFVIFFVFISF